MSASTLTHEEIWDDRDLVNSWNEALEEYKKYHSIAARGENIEALLQSFEDSKGSDLGAITQKDAPIDQTTIKPEQATELSGAMSVTEDPTHAPNISHNAILEEATIGKSTASGQAPHQAQDAPPSTGALSAVLPTIQDEAMRNLMMSWYYAGYYTGIQEGQQKAYAEMQGRNAGSGNAGTG